jgi:TRAP transporter 4TM/12TM fusion protein
VNRELNRYWTGALNGVGIVWCLIIIYTSLRYPFQPFIQGSLCLCLSLIFTFALYPFKKNERPRNHPPIPDMCLILLTLVIWGHILIKWEYWLYNPVEWTTMDLVFSGIFGLVILEGGRRVVGWPMVILCIAMIAYTLFGHLIPGAWGYSGTSFESMLWNLYQTESGYFGIVTSVMVNIVLMFIIFSPVFFSSGAGQAFMDISLFTGGRFRGGAAQVAVISSAIFGTVTGSAAANVATTGAVTIPAMRASGFAPNNSAAVESTASTGGQIMPPIMSVAAFIIASILGIPYLRVAKAAILPAVLYFYGVFAGILFASAKVNLGRLPPESIPKALEAFNPLRLARFLIPLFLIIMLLVMGYPPQTAACYALIAGVFMYMTIGRLSRSEVKKRFDTVVKGLIAASKSMAWIMAIIGVIQIIVSLIPLTGIGIKLSGGIIDLAGNNVLLAAMLTMVACILMGMGMPTPAAYVMTVVMIGPALAKLGMMPLAVHLFVLYFAVMSGLTPPVCATVFVAVGITSGARWPRTALIALGLAVAGWIIPYIFLFYPALLMEEGGFVETLVLFVRCLVVVTCFASAFFGFLFRRVLIHERLLLLGAGATLAFVPLNLLVGMVLLAAALLSQLLLRTRKT